ncbi:hypothetical protein NDI54_20090 [Haloarcula sp. S1AR25-5A]|uniref:Uncharacterized protein n=1 Tax=Haloarcula terrestris TaxID=2950533 RepID=A0AAE4F0R7_9EURY|nr:hypothetical protein [Haloarcula terrestris]MDS0223646.1 hypothetical protein [Haloarcula terrestris]
MSNIIQSIPFVSVSVFVATVSLVLQYLSHRSTTLDSVYEREEQIDGKIQKLGELFTDEFTADGSTLKIEFIKSTVHEKETRIYRICKYMDPFSNIQGTTKINFKATSSPELETGDYEITGDFEDAHLEKLALRVMPTTTDLLFVTVDSVIISDVAAAITEMDEIDNLEIQKTTISSRKNSE